MSQHSVDSNSITLAADLESMENAEPMNDSPSIQSIISTRPESQSSNQTFGKLKELVYDLCNQVDSLETQVKSLRTIKKEVKFIRSRLNNQPLTSTSKPFPLVQDFPLDREGYEEWSEELVRMISNHDGWFKNEGRKLDYLIESAQGWMRLFLQDRYGYRRRQRKSRTGRPLGFKIALEDLDSIFLPPRGRSLRTADDQWHNLLFEPGQSFSEFLPKFLFRSNRAQIRNRSEMVESLFNRLPRTWQARLEIRPFGNQKLPATLQDLVDRVFEIEAFENENESVANTHRSEQ